MTHLDRDRSVLEHIVLYCGQIEQTMERFGRDYEHFRSDQIYRNAVARVSSKLGS